MGLVVSSPEGCSATGGLAVWACPSSSSKKGLMER